MPARDHPVRTAGSAAAAPAGKMVNARAMRRVMRSKVGLIAYADRFGGDLVGLLALLGGPLPLWTAARAWSMIIRGGQIAVV